MGFNICATNVKDLAVQGAEPLFLIDGYTWIDADVEVAEKIIKGLCTGCEEANCALIGGGYAKTPALVTIESEYDIVGAITGVIVSYRKAMRNKDAILVWDNSMGPASAGWHSNGFNLIDNDIDEVDLSYVDQAPCNESNESIGQSLLVATWIYVQPSSAVVGINLVKGMAPITVE